MARGGEERLGREAWLEAAFTELARGGVEAVRVEPIAVRLGVTKGSFYWHFEDRSALLEAVLEAWERRATAAIIERVDARSDTPRERLELLMSFTTPVDRGAAIENAIRAWGQREPKVRRRLGVVDETRQAYVRDLLVASGLSRARATARARVFYLALIGEFTWVSHGGAPSGSPLWRELLQLLLSE